MNEEKKGGEKLRREEKGTEISGSKRKKFSSLSHFLCAVIWMGKAGGRAMMLSRWLRQESTSQASQDLIPRTNIKLRENGFLKLSSDLYMCTVAHV